LYILTTFQGLEVICGDLDSLDGSVRRKAEERGTRTVEDEDQDTTDFTKCMNYLRKEVFPRRPGVSNTVCLGGLGGRVDQGLSQLHHLYLEQKEPAYINGRVYLLSTEAVTFVLKAGRHSIQVRDPQAPSVLGKHIGIIPLKEPSMITTKGLKWDVTNWVTEFGGQMSTSNHVQEDVVEVATTSDVLFTIEVNIPHSHPGLLQHGSPIISMEDDMFFGTETNAYYR
jgi:thiamine pyrophosphokinase